LTRANSFSGDDGIILLDTTGGKFAMEKVWEKVREKIPSKPLKATVITHFHAGMNRFLTVQFENQTLFPSNIHLSWSYFRKKIGR